MKGYQNKIKALLRHLSKIKSLLINKERKLSKSNQFLLKRQRKYLLLQLNNNNNRHNNRKLLKKFR